jgi:hypothetical protein
VYLSGGVGFILATKRRTAIMRIIEENVVEFIQANGDMLKANWEETGFGWDFDIDFDFYGRLQEAGLLWGLAAYDGDTPVGYCTFMVFPHAWQKGLRVGNHDAMYIKPEYRCGTLCWKLIRMAEKIAHEHGASYFMWHTRAATPFADMLYRRGYHRAEEVVYKRI